MTDWNHHLSRDARNAHEDWIRAGRSGPGRLVLEGKDLRGTRMRGARLSAARFVRCDLRDAIVTFSFFNEVELVECTLDGSNFSNNNFQKSLIERSTFTGAELTLLDLRGSHLGGARFEGASLGRGSFDGTEVRATSFHRASVNDSTFDDGLFEDCDFREARLTWDPGLGIRGGTARGAHFVHCDLRGAHLDGLRLSGATFERCGLQGTLGKPDADGPYLVVAPDLSPGFDGTGVVAPAAVYALWGEPLAAPRPPPPAPEPPPKPPLERRYFVIVDTRTGQVTKSFHLDTGYRADAGDGSTSVPPSHYDKIIDYGRRNYPEPRYRLLEGPASSLDALLRSAGLGAPTPPEPEAPRPAEQAPPAGMVLIPGGPFRMGLSATEGQAWAESLAEDEAESGDDEWADMLHPLRDAPAPDPAKYLAYLRSAIPDRVVPLAAFFIDASPVTEQEYEVFVRTKGHRPPPHWKKGKAPSGKLAQRPVTHVSLEDARAYASWAGKRLPTEAEWEKAARGGDGRRYPWGEAWGPGMMSETGDAPETQIRGAHKEGASPYGCMDMLSFSWDWCDTPAAPYPESPWDGRMHGALDARGTWVLRGGDSLVPGIVVRHFDKPSAQDSNYGFRCAKSLS